MSNGDDFGFNGSRTFLIEIVLNGERTSVPADLTLWRLLQHLQIDASRVAVEIDRRIVRKTDWEQVEVPAGAEVEIVHFVGGGRF